MPADTLSYKETNYFSTLITDYLDQKDEFKRFYHRFPNPENFKEQIQEKKHSFTQHKREVLVNVLREQYANLQDSPAVSANIEALLQENTFSITTGHQLNLFTGPLYFLYKIVSAINLASTLKERYPENDFVPVYWMATEDHDFEEINFFNLNGKKFKWNSTHPLAGSDAVGNLQTEGLEEVFALFSAEIGGGKTAEYLKNLFESAYLNHANLSDATRFLAHQLFRDYGLVILDANNKALKTEFIPYLEKELTQKVSYTNTLQATQDLQEAGYGVQVNPREINLFYFDKGKRERILEKEGRYYVNDTRVSWSREGILEELNKNPEKFSPNVILRPLYEEVILPNLCYIGGGGELAYWFELKDLFDAVEVPFPILLLRNSALIETGKQKEKRKKLGISTADLFLKKHELINRKVRKISNIDIDFSPQKKHLTEQFSHMYQLAEQTDKTFLNAVKAQEVKQLKGLDNLEKRLLKAQKYKLKDEVSRISILYNELFPNMSLQERQTNFSEMYLQFGDQLIATLMDQLDPLDFKFKILSLGE